jgi:hypothetical protein
MPRSNVGIVGGETGGVADGEGFGTGADWQAAMSAIAAKRPWEMRMRRNLDMEGEKQMAKADPSVPRVACAPQGRRAFAHQNDNVAGRAIH